MTAAAPPKLAQFGPGSAPASVRADWPAVSTAIGATLRGLDPARAVLAIILAATILRVLLSIMLGLGVDESYMVAAGRERQLSYFDHPPLGWWLSWCGPASNLNPVCRAYKHLFSYGSYTSRPIQ